MKIVIMMMLLLGLTACQDNDNNKVETNMVTPTVEKHDVSTQAVKKDEPKPAIVQENTVQASQDVAATLAETKVEAPDATENKQDAVDTVQKTTDSTVKAAKDTANTAMNTANPCAVKLAKMASNPCSAKAAMDAAASSSATSTVQSKASSAVAKANPCAVKEVVVEKVNIKPFNAKKCKACHSVAKNKVGPAWKDVAEAYGSADALAAVFKSGFHVSERKVIAANSKWKGKAGMMTAQYKKLIKDNPDGAAKALFDAVKAGKI